MQGSCFSLEFILKCKRHYQVYDFYNTCLEKNMAEMRKIWSWCQNSENSNNDNLSLYYDHHFILTITPNSIIYCSNMTWLWVIIQVFILYCSGVLHIHVFLMKIYCVPTVRRSRMKKKANLSTWQLSIWNPSRVWEMHANVTPACWYQDFYRSSIKAALLSSSAS